MKAKITNIEKVKKWIYEIKFNPGESKELGDKYIVGAKQFPTVFRIEEIQNKTKKGDK